jgi:transposase-like protein
MKTTIDDIRTALVRSNEGVGRPYPARLRAQVLSHVERRRRAGIALEAVAAELGVAASTLRKWKRNVASSAPPAFCEVEIVSRSAATSALVVHGPAGLRIEGATIADIAEIVRRLA